MNFRQLEIFLAILEHGSFSAGARACLISQSTASQSIAALEEELGSRLLERVHGGVNETPAGRVFKKHAKQILSDINSAYESLERQRGTARTILTIAASTIPCAYLVPPVLKKLYDELPDLKVKLIGGDSKATLERIHDREADIGIVGNRFEERGLTYQPLRKEELHLYAPAKSDVVKAKAIKIDDFLKLPLIVRESGSGTAKAVIDAMLEAGIDMSKIRPKLETESTEAVKAAILNGLGVGFLSEFAVVREVERGELVRIDIKGLTVSRMFYQVRRLGSDPTGASQLFEEAMKKAWGK